ncbi:MAG: HAD hydrolase-like protein [Patescibacteria group bacterium]|jgi:phosphoglycolate phosphatase-like HAD superfamily hydrolase
MIKLVAFDWNGTLFADTQAILKAMNIIARSYGFKKISLLQYQKTFEIPISNFWVVNGFTKKSFEKEGENVQKIFIDSYEPLADECRTRSGTKEVLKELKKQKIQAIIYSNHTRLDIHRQVSRLKIDGHLLRILAREYGDHSHLHGRSKEKKLVQYIKEYKIKPKEVVTVGDTSEETEIGKKHGFATVAITGGYSTVARLKKHKPDFLIHNMKELIGIIKKLN